MRNRIKSLIRRMFYRSEFIRIVVGMISVLTGRNETIGFFHLLSYLDKNALGPLQRDEAIALFGIVATLRPKTVVEFGFFHGHSAFNFLCAMSPDARLYSYDISDDSLARATHEFGFEKRLTFIHKSQTAFDPADIQNRSIDFVFFDAAHELELNIETFRRVAPHLAPGAIIAVHDTGLWEKSFFSPIHHEFAQAGHANWVTPDLLAHQPHERAFVNWISAEYEGFGAIHLHSNNTLRHGLTLIQQQMVLATGTEVSA